MSKNMIKLWPILLIAGIVPSALIFALIFFYGVNAPFGDQWELVSYFEKGMNGELTNLDFWNPHNEHITPFSLFIQYHLAKISNWNTRYEMFVSLGLAIVNYLILAYLFRNTISSLINSSELVAKASIYIFVFLIAFEFLSINQLENWLWGWQIQWFIHVMGVLLVFSLLSFAVKGKTVIHHFSVFGAIAGGILATFSLAQGILVWIIGIPMFFLGKHLRKYLIPWLGCFLISLYMYQANNGHTVSIFQRLEVLDFMEFFRFILVYLGGALNQGEVFGSVLLTLSVLAVAVALVLYRHNLKIIMPWILLGTYIVSAGVIISIGRSHLGAYMGGSSRYASLSNLAFISLLVLLFCILLRFRYRQFFINSILLLGLVLVAFSWYQSFPSVKGYHAHINYIRNCLDTYSSINETCLQHVYPNRTLLNKKILVLERLGYANLGNLSHNSQGETSPQASKKASLVSVGENITVKGKAKKSGVYHSDENTLSQKDLNAYGTWAGSDANTGRIHWELSIDRPITSFEAIVFEYKTGPSLENLHIFILDDTEKTVYEFQLQEARSWTTAKINITDLAWDGTGMLSIDIVDTGTDWGQWIAIHQPKFESTF